MSDFPKDWGKVSENPVPFGDRLSALCAAEAVLARRDPDRMAAMIERLTNSLAFTIAINAGGNSEAASQLVEGVIAHLFERATAHERIAGILSPTTLPGGRDDG